MTPTLLSDLFNGAQAVLGSDSNDAHGQTVILHTRSGAYYLVATTSTQGHPVLLGSFDCKVRALDPDAIVGPLWQADRQLVLGRRDRLRWQGLGPATAPSAQTVEFVLLERLLVEGKLAQTAAYDHIKRHFNPDGRPPTDWSVYGLRQYFQEAWTRVYRLWMLAQLNRIREELRAGRQHINGRLRDVLEQAATCDDSDLAWALVEAQALLTRA